MNLWSYPKGIQPKPRGLQGEMSLMPNRARDGRNDLSPWEVRLANVINIVIMLCTVYNHVYNHVFNSVMFIDPRYDELNPKITARYTNQGKLLVLSIGHG